MTTVRKPLVLIDGKPVELPANDVIVGAPSGPTGLTGATGATGAKGDTGADGEGVPTGGTTGQVLAKASGTDFDTEWVDGGGGGMTKIGQVITSGSQSTIAFSSIPNSYTDLMVVIQGRDTATGSTDLGLRLKINSDGTAANYSSSEQFTGFDTSSIAQLLASNTSGIRVGSIPGTSGNANAIGQVSFIIANYKGTTFYKTVNGQCVEWTNEAGATVRSQHFGAVWKSTAAITDLLLTAGGTAFVNGTTATLYGLG